MNPFEMVVLIVAIVMGTSVLRARYAAGSAREDSGETERLRGEIGRLRDRVTVLERIVTDGDRNRAAALEHEIEALRDGRS